MMNRIIDAGRTRGKSIATISSRMQEQSLGCTLTGDIIIVVFGFKSLRF